MIALLLATPTFAVYAQHFLLAPAGRSPTGFLQYDQPYYMANAREHFDGGNLHLAFGLPFTWDPETPRVYFQPLFFILGAVRELGDLPPGWVYALAGLVAGVVLMRITMALLGLAAGQNPLNRGLELVFLAWGGGLLALAGLALTAVAGQGEHATPMAAVFRFDPELGYWFLNLGRNSVYTTEAMYHCLFLGTVCALIQRRWAVALLLAVVTCVSHPFTGSQLLGAVIPWLLVERLTRHPGAPGWRWLTGFSLLALLHFGYYLIFLNTSPDHRRLQEQWTLEWTVPWLTALLAYGPALGFVVATGIQRGFKLALLGAPKERLFLCWASTSILLSHHELFMRAHQPLHFTRGYVWTALFLLGLPSLSDLLTRLRSMPHPVLRSAALVTLALLFCSDNAVWFAARLVRLRGNEPEVYLLADQEHILTALNEERYADALLVSSDHAIGYLATCYSPLRSWASHGFNTPDYDERVDEMRRFFETGVEPAPWAGRHIVVVVRTAYLASWGASLKAARFQGVWSGRRLAVFERLH